MTIKHLTATTALFLLLGAPTVYANEQELLKRIDKLEARISELEQQQIDIEDETPAVVNPSAGKSAFNPYIGVVLNGSYNYYSNDDNKIAGFQIGEEGASPDKGFSLGESEINIGANVDDKFLANLTVAVVSEDGEDKIELEEAFVQTLGLPYGLGVTAGRLKPVFGYLNEKHLHTDDFADRPLPYRAFLNNAFHADGAQVSMVLPTEFYSEIGGGLYNGKHFPAASEGSGNGTATAYAKFGGDISDTQSWLAGVSYLYAKSRGDGRETDDLTFVGKDNVYGFSLKYSYAPNGNGKENEFAVLGEYLIRDEKGKYAADGGAFVQNNSTTSGWYIQPTYKFNTNWKVGYRYARLETDDAAAGLIDTAIDAKSHNPEMHSAMIEWNNSEFSRIRLQYNLDKSDFKDDNQFIVEYTMSFGAHNAHTY